MPRWPAIGLAYAGRWEGARFLDHAVARCKVLAAWHGERPRVSRPVEGRWLLALRDGGAMAR